MLSAMDFSAAVNWIYYTDSAGRQVAYNFKTGSMLANGTVSIPAASGHSTAPGEAAAAFKLTSEGGPQTESLVSGVYKLAVQQPVATAPQIPSQNITVDGSPADWATVVPYITDKIGDSTGSPGTDIVYVKAAYSPDRSLLNLLVKLNGNVDQNYQFYVSIDRNLNGNEDPGDYLIEIHYDGTNWVADANTYSSSNGQNDVPVTISGSLAVVGQYIEGSVATADIGLPGPVNIYAEGGGNDPATGHETGDTASTGLGDMYGAVALYSGGLVASSSANWTWAASFSKFANVTGPNLFHQVGLTNHVFGNTPPPRVLPELNAGWFTGSLNGASYTNALLVMASLDGEDGVDYHWSWDPSTGGGKLLTGLNPATTKLDLKEVISNGGQTDSFYYRLNSTNANQNGADWVLLVSKTLPAGVGSMITMPDAMPDIAIDAGVPNFPGFQAKVNWTNYQDAAGRVVNDNFASDSMLFDGTVSIPPASGYSTDPGEASAAFALTPDGGLGGATLDNTGFVMSIQQPVTTLPAIPVKDVTVDGSPADWAGTAPYIQDALADSPAGPATDIDVLKVAYSSDYSHLNFLLKLADNANTGSNFNLSFDKNLDGKAGQPGDYGINIYYDGTNWTTYGTTGNGIAATINTSLVVSGDYIEGSINAADLGLPGAVNIMADSNNASGLAVDRASTGFARTVTHDYLTATGLTASPSDSWSWAASFSDFFYGGNGRQMDNDVSLDAAPLSGPVHPGMTAGWFTGTFNGVSYKNVLSFGAWVQSDQPLLPYDWEWNPGIGGGGLILTGLNPATTKVDLKEVVSNSGQTADFYYRINSPNTDATGSDWILMVSDTLPAGIGSMAGVDATAPFLKLNSDIVPVAPPAGTWKIEGTYGSGSVTIQDPSGLTGPATIVSGAITRDDTGTTTNMTGGQVLAMPDGKVYLQANMDDPANPIHYGIGAIDPARDVFAQTNGNQAEASSGTSGVDLAIRHDVTFSVADVSGTWALTVFNGTGTMTFDGKGKVTGGGWTTCTGNNNHVTSGSYTVAPDGTVSATITVAGTDPGTQSFTGVLDDSKDLLAIKGNPPAPNGDLAVLVRHTGTFSNADLVGQWNIVGPGGYRTVLLDGKGHILSGSGVDPGGFPFTVTGGTYSVAATGRVTVVVNNAEGSGTWTHHLAGTLTDSRGVLVLSSTVNGEILNDNLLVMMPTQSADLGGVFGTTWTLPSAVIAGKALSGSVSVVVSNAGNVTLPTGQTVTINFVAHDTTNPSNPDVTLLTLNNQSVSALAAGKTKTFTGTVSLPTGLLADNYQILANIVPVQTLTESDTANNTVTLTAAGATKTIVSVAPFVDLAGTFGTTWTLPSGIIAGKALSGSVSVVVKNLGNVALPSGQQANIQFVAQDATNPGNPPITLLTLSNQSVTALAGGGVKTFTGTVSLPAGLPMGSYQVLANIVPVQALTESNPANNTVTVTATGATKTITVVPAFVDLAGVLGTTWTLPSSVMAGKALSGSVSVVVKNLGNVALPTGQQADIQFVARDLTNPANPDIPLMTLSNQSLSALAANGSKTFSTTVSRPAGLPADTYQILANIVPVQALTELNLANNLVALTATGLSKTVVSS